MSKLENYFGRQRSGPPIWLAVVLVSAFALAAFSHIMNSTSPDRGSEIVLGQAGTTTDPDPEPPTPTATTTDPGTVGLVSRVEPAISSVTLRGGDSVRLAVDLYGAQDVLDNTLSQDVAITWSDGGAGGDFDTTAGRLVVYTAPSSPGTHTVTASVNGSCSGDCSAEFSITVRRASASPPEADDPVNPSGEIPGVLTDSGGTAYAVFAPVEGGRFSGEGFGVSAQPGAVPDGEIIGINMSEEGGASNIGATHQRYTLMGSAYSIEVIDSAGAEVSAYRLDTYAEACVPLPDALRANISDVSLVAINDDGTLTILTSNVKIAADGSLDVCGRVSSLPATVAAGSEGAPADFPTPTPTPEIEEPDTGGTSPAPLALFLMLVLGAMLVSAPLVLRRRWTTRNVSR